MRRPWCWRMQERTVLCQQSDLRLRGAHNGNAAAAAQRRRHSVSRRRRLSRVCGGFAPCHTVSSWWPQKVGWNTIMTRKPRLRYRPSVPCRRSSNHSSSSPGYDKGTPFDELGQVMHARARAVLVYGTTAPKLALAMQQAAAVAPEQPAPCCCSPRSGYGAAAGCDARATR